MFRTLSPLIIAIAGDVIYGARPTPTPYGTPYGNEQPLIIETQANVLPFLKSCAEIAPTYLSLGNHEYILCEDDLRLIYSTGVVVLDNSFISLGSVLIGGLTSGYVTDYRRRVVDVPGRYPRMEQLNGVKGVRTASDHIPETEWLGSFTNLPGYHILLCRHPEYIDLIPDSIELVLSGHAHGGQWRCWSPKTRKMEGVFAPGQGLWPKLTSGVYDGRLVVSRGLSNTAKIPRINTPVEVVFVEPG